MIRNPFRRRNPEPSARIDEGPRSPDEILLEWLTNLPEGEAQRIRRDAGWTQVEIANHVGVLTAGMVSKWEHGHGWSRVSGLRYAQLLRELEVMRADGPVLVTERSARG